MAINKNFVVKNGLEVNTQLLYADGTTNKVGIASTAPNVELDVRGGIAATNTSVSGVSTVIQGLRVGDGGSVLSVTNVAAGSSVGVGTTSPGFLLDVRAPAAWATGTGVTALYVQGDAVITGDIDIGDDVSLDSATIGHLSVSGMSTFSGNIDINSNDVLSLIHI